MSVSLLLPACPGAREGSKKLTRRWRPKEEEEKNKEWIALRVSKEGNGEAVSLTNKGG